MDRMNYKNITSFAIICIILFSAFNVCGQSDTTFIRSGKIYGDLFVNSNYNISKGYASFRLNRLHFGYKYNFSENLYFNGMMESALEDYQPIADSVDYNNITNLFEFCLGFSFDKIEGKFGLIGTELNQQQEQLWQHRYVDKVFADKYGYAPTNDFGFLVIYKANDMLKFDVALVNGEGHKNLQSDSTFRVAGGATLNLAKKFVARVYSDVLKYPDALQTNFIGIFGYTSDLISAGIEWNAQYNNNGLEGFNRNGFSGYGSGNITKKIQLFARYDFVSSNKPTGYNTNWNTSNDGSLIIAGIQYKLIDAVTLAIDYRNWTSEDTNIDAQSFLFFDVAVNF